MKPNQSIHLHILQPGLSKTEPVRTVAVFPQIPSPIERFQQYITRLITKELTCESSPIFQERLREEAIEAINMNNIIAIKREGEFIEIILKEENDSTRKNP